MKELEDRKDDDVLKDAERNMKKNNKSKFKMTFKKVLVVKALISLTALVIIASSIVSLFAFIYIIDEEGTSKVTEKAVGNIVKEKVKIAEGENGNYLKIEKDFVDDFIIQLNKAFFDGYFYEEDPEKREDEFVYDEESADITEDDIIGWFRTKNYKPYLIRMIKAQIASSYPRIGTYEGEEGTEDEFGNKFDKDGNYVVQGIIKIKRTKISKERSCR